MGDSKMSKEKAADPTITENEARGHWTKQIEFTLSCVGYAIGLGNIWRFPYLCIINGGGAFLLPYIFFTFVCGLPMFFIELALGQFGGLGSISVWKMCPIIKGMGWTACFIVSIWAIYANVIILWILYYLGLSFASEVPWKTCDNSWNTPSCIDLGAVNHTLSNITEVSAGLVPQYQANLTKALNESKTAAEEFFLYRVLDISGGIGEFGVIKWDLFLCLFASWLIVFLCMIKGIKSSGKVVYITATVPYLFLTILLVRGVTLPGSLEGIKFFLIPEWSQLLDIKIWNSACLQVFYTLGTGWGCITSMSSYSRFHNNCVKDAVVTCTVCCLTSVFAGFVTFSVIGFMAHKTGLPIKEVITQGPGLAFIAYPEVVAQLPVSPFWAVCFFFMLLTIGLDSQFGSLEAVCTGIADELPRSWRKHRVWLNLSVCVVFFIFGIPLVSQAGMYIFQVLDWYVAPFALMTILFLECIGVCYIYGIGRFYRDLTLMLNRRPSIFWAVCWCGLIPVMIVIAEIFTIIRMTPPTFGDYSYPLWAEICGWTESLVTLIPIPVMALYFIIRAKGSLLQRLMAVLQPADDWGPAPEKYHKAYKLQNQHQTWRQRMSMWQGNQDFINGNLPEPEGVALNPLPPKNGAAGEPYNHC